ncbi:hypothetical protein P7D22_22895, partial [Lichenihabitans sp. Uapishka_5]|nr:hypothetical protein [Lichenihabitans sp. Uapishka_5]
MSALRALGLAAAPAPAVTASTVDKTLAGFADVLATVTQPSAPARPAKAVKHDADAAIDGGDADTEGENREPAAETATAGGLLVAPLDIAVLAQMAALPSTPTAVATDPQDADTAKASNKTVSSHSGAAASTPAGGACLLYTS